MDLRVLVITADHGLAELVRAQVENLGCTCSVAEAYPGISSPLEWADAAIVDLTGEGIDDLNRLRVEAPRLRLLAVAPDESQVTAAQSAGAHQVLAEPFSITELIDGVRALDPRRDAEVVDLTTGERRAAPVAPEPPWWATR